MEAEATIDVTASLYRLLEHLGRPRLLQRIAQVRDAAAATLGDTWNHARFLTQRTRMEEQLAIGSVGDVRRFLRVLREVAEHGRLLHAGLAGLEAIEHVLPSPPPQSPARARMVARAAPGASLLSAAQRCQRKATAVNLGQHAETGQRVKEVMKRRGMRAGLLRQIGGGLRPISKTIGQAVLGCGVQEAGYPVGSGHLDQMA